MGKKLGIGPCTCCGRVTELTFHHLIPRSQHRKTWCQKRFTRPERAAGIAVCRLCHNGIHDRFDEKTLGREYHTLAALLSDADLQRHFQWAAKQK